MVKASTKRRYDTSARRASAQQTRRRIITVARRLFLKRGYAATTMAAIAEAANVSIETIYLSVGGKPSLVRFLVETALSGADEPVPALEREGVKEIRAEPDPHRKLQMFGRMVRQLNERLAPIWQVTLEAAPFDPELRSLIGELKQRHVGSMRAAVQDLVAAGPLRKEISSEVAADVLWAMNSPEFYGLLVAGRGWSGDRFEAWFADALQRMFLGDGHPRARSTARHTSQ
ncbi:MAG TPA: TetR/AcrR family transcriptional regulator [Candidatus Dormibacteraeota bacterium]|nr:TetR/AcrR family transcriptional regulator [Candidatus Dormibacteraeota bacterium]